jgi:hypothetical protein
MIRVIKLRSVNHFDNRYSFTITGARFPGGRICPSRPRSSRHTPADGCTRFRVRSADVVGHPRDGFDEGATDRCLGILSSTGGSLPVSPVQPAADSEPARPVDEHSASLLDGGRIVSVVPGGSNYSSYDDCASHRSATAQLIPKQLLDEQRHPRAWRGYFMEPCA